MIILKIEIQGICNSGLEAVWADPQGVVAVDLLVVPQEAPLVEPQEAPQEAPLVEPQEALEDADKEEVQVECLVVCLEEVAPEECQAEDLLV